MKTELYMNLRRNTHKDMYEHKAISNSGGTLQSDFFFKKTDIVVLTHEFAANESSFHGHDFFELNYVISGICRQNLDNKKQVTLKPGNICILNPNAMHSCNIETEDDAIINLLIKPELIHNTFTNFASNNSMAGRFFLNYIMPENKLENHYLLFENGFDEYTDFLIERIVYEFLSKKPYYNSNMKNLLSLLLSNILEKSLLNKNDYDSKAEEIVEYIAAHINTVTLQSTAAHFYMHPNYLSSYIKKHTNRNYAEIVSAIRLTQAQNLLTNTSISIDEISNLIGYSDTLSFYNMFKRLTNMTPSQYRKSKNIEYF